MKKYLLSIGAVATALAPIITVVSCGSNKPKEPVIPVIDKDSARADKALELVKAKDIETKINTILTTEVKKKSAGEVTKDQKTKIKTEILLLIKNKMEGTDDEKVLAEAKIKIVFIASHDGTSLEIDIKIDGGDISKEITIVGFTKAPVDVEVANKALNNLTVPMLDGLVDKNKKASVEKSKITDVKIRNLDAFSSLNADQKALISSQAASNDEEGTITVEIKVKGGTTKNLELTGFMTQKRIDIAKATAAVNALKGESFNGKFVKDNKASAENKKVTSDLIKGLPGINTLSDNQKALITAEGVSDDVKGTLTITISVEGGSSPKVIVISGFKTTSKENIAKAEAAIANVTNTMLDGLVDKANKASVEKSKITNVEIRNLVAFSSLNADQKALITVTSVDDDVAGTLIITISVTGGSTPKAITLDGFLTTSKENIAKAEAAIANVTETMLNHLVVKTNKASVEKSKITNVKIRGLGAFSSLSANQKALITVTSVDDDVAGTLIITISVTGGSTPKIITLDGFLTTGKENIDKVEAAIAKVTNTMLDGLVDKANKASVEKSKITNVKIRNLVAFSSLSVNQKALITVTSVDDDVAGTLIITISVTGGSTPKTITLDGFLTTSKENIAKAEEAIANVTDTMLNPLVDKTNKASVEKSKITEEKIRGLGAFSRLNTDQKALITFTSVADDAAGTLKITISVIGGSTPKAITLDGFLTTSKENIDKAEAAIANVTNTMLNPLVAKANKASVEKSKITNVEIRNLVAFSRLNADQKALITFTSVADDAAGTLKITISVTGGSTPKTITLDGFLTTSKENIAKAEAAIANVTDTMLNSLVVKTNKASVEKSKITEEKIRGLSAFSRLNTDQKALITFTSVADDAAGTLKITISVTGGSTPKTITLDGFLTTSKENIAKAEAAIANVTDTMLNPLVDKTNKASVEKSKITEEKIRGLGAFSRLNTDQKALITFTSVADDAAGTLKITISVTGGSTPKTITLDGFLTTSKENIAKAEAAIANVTDTMLNPLVDKTNKASVEKSKITEEKIRGLGAFSRLNTDQKALITFTSVADDTAGTLKITISVTGGSTPKTITLDGFLTTSKENIAKAEAAIANVTDTMLNPLVDKTNKASVEKSKITEEKIRGLGAFSRLNTDQKALITFTSVADDAAGTLKITISVTGGSTPKTITLDGFLTTSKENIAKAEAAIANVTDTMLNPLVDKTNKASVEKSKITEEKIRGLGAFSRLNTDQKALITFTSVADDAAGTLKITISVTGGSTPKTITLDGFLTTSKENIAKAEAAIANVTDTMLNPLVDKTKKASVEKSKITEEKIRGLGAFSRLNTDQKALITFTSVADDAAGTLKITISVTGGSTPKTITLDGFLTTSKENIAKAEAAIANVTDTMLNPLVDKTNKASVEKSKITEEKIRGLGAFSRLNTDQKALITFTSVADDAAGTLKITISVTGGSTPKTITLDGFLTTSKENIAKAEAAIANVTDTMLNPLVDKTNKASVEKSKITEEKIRGLGAFSRLNTDQKALITFTSVADDAAGTLKITISVTGGSTPKTITLDGFLTTSKENIAKAEAAIANVTDTMLNPLVDKTNKASVEKSKITEEKIRGLGAFSRLNTDQKALITFTSVADDTAGTLKITISVTGGSTPKTITLDGFLTTSKENIAKAEAAIANVTDTMLNPLVDKTNKASVEKSKITEEKIRGLGAFSRLNTDQKALITFTSVADDAAGTLKITISVTGGSTPKTITLDGFLTTSKENIAKAEAAIANVTDTMLNPLVDKTNKASVEKSKITEEKIRGLGAFSRLNTDQKALITFTSVADDAAGTLKITISVTGGSTPKTITLDGFLTTSKENIAKAEAAIANVTDTMLNPLVDKTNKASVEKSKITEEKIRGLGAFSRLNTDQKALITFTSVADDAAGTLKITISVTGGSTPKTITLDGFLTTSKENIAKAEAAIANVTDTMLNPLVDKTNKASVEKSKITEEKIRGLGAFSRLNTDQKALITFTSVADDAAGTLKITISVTGGSTPKTITLDGFLTTSKENIAKAEAAIANVTDTMLNPLVDKTNKASVEKSKITEEKIRGLGAFSRLNTDQKALITFTSVADDAAGTLKITISVTGGSTPKTITLDGFLK